MQILCSLEEISKIGWRLWTAEPLQLSEDVNNVKDLNMAA